MSEEERFIEVVRLAAVQAGAVARRLQGRVAQERKPGQGSLESEALTVVDLAAQDVILHALHARLPGVAVDAEEDTETVRLFPPATAAGPLVVVDPVDGTLNYIRGSRDFAVMAALLRDGVYRAALIHFPMTATTWWAVRGGGCWREDAAGERRRARVDGAPDHLMTSPRVPASWRAALAAVAAEVSDSRCSAVDALAPALGRARAAVSEGRPDRRRAIGYLLTVEAGGVVRLGDRAWAGEDPDRLPPDARPAIVAADATLADRVARALEPFTGDRRAQR